MPRTTYCGLPHNTNDHNEIAYDSVMRYAAAMPASNVVAIFAVDPGETTGCSTVLANLRFITVAAAMRRARSKGNIKTWVERGSFTEQAWTISRAIVEFYYNVHIERGLIEANSMYIVVEDFQLRMMSANLAPIWVTAGLETLLSNALDGSWDLDGFYSKQTPSEAKGFVSDEMLKRWGLFHKRTDHERDALRHIARRIDKLLKGE